MIIKQTPKNVDINTLSHQTIKTKNITVKDQNYMSKTTRKFTSTFQRKR